ncbi:hypothetical protein [Flavobacterium sp. MDT1-60]|nr:hypothetical protein [Flavobacterium sp. MDT1-60]QOG05013.1 hypothetical protein IHE43_19300 [Flavobacterium sp. MDT1-60]
METKFEAGINIAIKLPKHNGGSTCDEIEEIPQNMHWIIGSFTNRF